MPLPLVVWSRNVCSMLTSSEPFIQKISFASCTPLSLFAPLPFLPLSRYTLLLLQIFPDEGLTGSGILRVINCDQCFQTGLGSESHLGNEFIPEATKRNLKVCLFGTWVILGGGCEAPCSLWWSSSLLVQLLHRGAVRSSRSSGGDVWWSENVPKQSIFLTTILSGLSQ